MMFSSFWCDLLRLLMLSGFSSWRLTMYSLEIGMVWHLLGCCRNGCKRPVLKHGPRSLTAMRVSRCQARARNESEWR
ncbi:hypothetical protein CC77DRAFT_1078366 [Alternaria alternata]|uniref:Secreted protein n=1 Tax=Alternaria alternata TaxID=5599 RepID=A0A177D915_ALTAL|nr:hypothetical protein CC77DRAFT_1078366 [Alternaria alternata]OAG16244.1 hypothetical protein CC77DRAFT_1078366 [Alternaria alternata]